MSKAKEIKNEIIENVIVQKNIFKILVFLLIILLITYMYLIGSITFNILARKTFESNAKNLGNEVSELEIVYLNKANQINKNYVLSLGFVESEPNIFVTKNASQVAVR